MTLYLLYSRGPPVKQTSNKRSSILTPKWNKFGLRHWIKILKALVKAENTIWEWFFNHYHFTGNLFPSWAKERVHNLKWNWFLYIKIGNCWEDTNNKIYWLCALFCFYLLLFKKAVVMYVINERHISAKYVSHRGINNYVTTQIWEKHVWLNWNTAILNIPNVIILAMSKRQGKKMLGPIICNLSAIANVI